MSDPFVGDVVERPKAKNFLKEIPVDRDVLELARERIREAIPLFDTLVVSFSGGKDSTVVLNLTIEAYREMGLGKVKAVFFDEEAIPYQTADYVRRAGESGDIDLTWLCVPVRHRNACTRKDPWWFCWDPDVQELWVREMPPEATTWDKIDNFPIARDQRPSIPDTNGFLFPPLKYGRVGLLMGIRADESLTRRRAVSRRAKGEHNYFAHWNEGYRNLTKIYPIYDWRTSDVWLAPQMFGWDYNRAYDVMEMAGMSHAIQRCAPPFGEEPLQLLWMYSVCFPEVWDKMCKRVPGAATAARYSRTHLYSFVGGAIKHPDMTWPEFIVYTLNKHPEPYRSEITARVKGWLDLHYEKTTDPLAANAAHPLTGTSWRFLLNIASRGDYKDRRQPGAKVTKENWDAVVRRYNEEIAEMRARGEVK